MDINSPLLPSYSPLVSPLPDPYGRGRDSGRWRKVKGVPAPASLRDACLKRGQCMRASAVRSHAARAGRPVRTPPPLHLWCLGFVLKAQVSTHAHVRLHFHAGGLQTLETWRIEGWRGTLALELSDSLKHSASPALSPARLCLLALIPVSRCQQSSVPPRSWEGGSFNLAWLLCAPRASLHPRKEQLRPLPGLVRPQPALSPSGHEERATCGSPDLDCPAQATHPGVPSFAATARLPSL